MLEEIVIAFNSCGGGIMMSARDLANQQPSSQVFADKLEYIATFNVKNHDSSMMAHFVFCF